MFMVLATSELYVQLCSRAMERPEPLKSRKRWEEDLGEISEVQWRRIFELGPLVSVSPSQTRCQLP